MERIIVVSDLHCGSSVAICHPDFETNEGQGVRLNTFQKWAWEQWTEFEAYCKKHKPYTLVLNGDLIEGDHHRTTEVISNDPADHIRCAQHVLSRVVEYAERVYVVRGTSTHTGPSSEHGLATWCGAVPDRRHHRPAWDRLDLDIGGIHCRFVHHGVGTRREWTRATALNVDISSHQIASLKAGKVVPRVLGLGHFHHFAMYGDGDCLVFRTPAWQFNTRHTMKVVPWAENEVGAAMLEFAGDGAMPVLTPWIRKPRY